MANWPRTIEPSTATRPIFPGHLGSWGHSGKGQTRGIMAAGAMWEEWYPPLEYNHEDVREFLTIINNYWRGGGSFDIENYLVNTRLGSGAGTPQVDGASQTGSTLHTDGWTASQSGVLLAGDIIRSVGVPYVMEVQADVDSDSGGDADVLINPPIWNAPDDDAAITTTGVRFTCVLATQPNMPRGGRGRFFGGLHLVFRELL